MWDVIYKMHDMGVMEDVYNENRPLVSFFFKKKKRSFVFN